MQYKLLMPQLHICQIKIFQDFNILLSLVMYNQNHAQELPASVAILD
jgi:hypothetical protein